MMRHVRGDIYGYDICMHGTRPVRSDRWFRDPKNPDDVHDAFQNSV